LKTVHLSSGNHAEAGAMRIPSNRKHFLTNYYIDKFKLNLIPFKNDDPHTLYHVFGHTFPKNELGNRLNIYFPGWKGTTDFRTPSELWDATKREVVDDFQTRMAEAEAGGEDKSLVWKEWVTKWSTMSVKTFLRQKSTYSELRPWSEAAIEAFEITTSLTLLDASLAEILREDMGEWWTDNMHQIKGGMDALSNAFLSEKVKGKLFGVHIRYGQKVHRIEKNDNNKITINGGDEEYDYCLVTVPLGVLRQIDFNPPLIPEKQMALGQVHMVASCKVLLQCRRRFWRDLGIRGGCSRTNLPIRQVYYPTEDAFTPGNDDGRGVLVCYAWEQDAVLLSSLSEEERIRLALDNVANIHPEINDVFEVC
jgi:monoamine oxidase